ncbi:hypothetical protein E2I00_012834, partial [Balaenoptera physalus]
MAAPGRIPRGGAIAAAELAEAALWGAAMSASACALILTKPETADRRRRYQALKPDMISKLGKGEEPWLGKGKRPRQGGLSEIARPKGIGAN